jgi:probable HAF family extracellular repeat protein
MRNHAPVALLVPWLFTPAASHAQSLTSIGTAPGGTSSAAYGVSADGQVVAAYSSGGTAGTVRACRWTAQHGMETISPEGVQRFAYAVSADGSTLVGSGSQWDGGFVYSSEHGFESFDDYANLFLTLARGVNADGSVVVGVANFPENLRPHAMRWRRESEVFEDLGTLAAHEYSEAYDISPDGAVICGNSRPVYNSDVDQRAVRWTSAGIEVLSVPADHIATGAYGVSGDASTIVGVSLSPTFEQIPVRWRGLSIERLPILPHLDPLSAAFNASWDGSFIVGVQGRHVGEFQTDFHAVLWSPYLGVVDLNTYLPTIGIDTTGWHLEYATGISADGRTIVGFGTLHAQTRGFVLTLPPPCGTADFNNDADHGTDADIEAFFACLAGNCCPRCPQAGADFNADGDPGTDQDIEAFFRVLAGGTC